MTFDEWWKAQGFVFDDGYAYENARRAFEAGKLEAAEHILALWREPWPVSQMPFINRLEVYVEELK